MAQLNITLNQEEILQLLSEKVIESLCGTEISKSSVPEVCRDLEKDVYDGYAPSCRTEEK